MVPGVNSATGVAQENRSTGGWRRSLAHAALALIVTRLLLVAAGWAAISRIDHGAPSGSFVGVRPVEAPWLEMWARWDANWYLDIALRGYRAPLPEGVYDMRPAFFPVLPFAIRALTPVVGSPVLAGIVLSNIALLAALTALHAWTTTRISREVSDRLVWIYATFPTSFFLSCVYTESFQLASLGAAWWAASCSRWAVSGALIAAGTWCRPTGVLAVPALVIKAWREEGTERSASRWPRLMAVTVPAALAVAGYLLFSRLVFGDAWAPFRVQTESRAPLDWPWQAFVRFWQEGPSWSGYANSILDAGLAVGALAALPFTFAVVGVAEGVFATLATLVPLASGLVSFARILLVIFPIHVLLARGLTGARLRVVLAAGMALQLGLFAWFVRYGWVG